MTFRTNPIQQREFYKGFRELHDERQPKCRHCAYCDKLIKFDDGGILEGANGELYCSINCVNEDIE